eukprot:SAG31_NODE_1106_length_9878_cov_4.621331_11_plen_98_part_00
MLCLVQMKHFVQLMARVILTHGKLFEVRLFSFAAIAQEGLDATTDVGETRSMLQALKKTVKERCLVCFIKDLDGLRFLEKVRSDRFLLESGVTSESY